MLDEFDLSKQNNESSERVLKNKFAAFEVKKQEFQIIQQEYDDATKVQQIGDQIEKISDEIAWAIVKEKEQNIQKFIDKVATEKLQREGYINNNKSRLDSFDSYDEKIKEAEKMLTDASKKLTDASEETSDITKKISSFEKQKSAFKVCFFIYSF